ncbi:MAG: family 43 glycosylhydrolase, partial [Acetatifactor sp.]|nr:family 43 glycosylhydrolase [Acetatifactor sp.]
MEQKINGPITEYNNPFIIQRADPFVGQAPDGSYYFTASVPAYDKIILRHAETIEQLAQAEEITVWTRHESGPMSEHIWAPEIHYLFGKWYIYFAGDDREGMWHIRPYVLECTGQDPMKDAWVERGMMQCADEDEFSFRAFSLDATILENRGEYYYIWA